MSVELDLSNKEELLSDSFHKKIMAAAWKENDIEQRDVVKKLNDLYEEVFDLYGEEFAGSFYEYMNDKTSEFYNKQAEERSKFSVKDTFVTCEDGVFKQKEIKTEMRINLTSAAELFEKDLPPIKYAVENMIPEGETVLSAPFKSGKSWMMIQMCLAVAKGEKFLGFNTNKGTAVYLALEDCDKFAQERLRMISKEAPNNFFYSFTASTLDTGLLEELEYISSKFDDLRLIVIDTLAFVEYSAKRGESAYKCDYRTGSALKQWADSKGVSVVVVTHTTKLVHPEDVFSNTSGTNGVTAAADSIITISKEKRTDKTAVLAITGRRIRESFHNIQMDDNCVWQNLGITSPDDKENRKAEEEMNAFRTSDIRKAVLKIVEKDNFKGKAKDLKEKAEEFGIYLLDDAKTIGGFMHKYQNYFIRYENIKVSIINNGNAPKIYKLQAWEPAENIT